jgi:hypothetical protein
MTTEGEGASSDGNWKHMDFPVPVPERTNTSLPAAHAQTTSRCRALSGGGTGVVEGGGEATCHCFSLEIPREAAAASMSRLMCFAVTDYNNRVTRACFSLELQRWTRRATCVQMPNGAGSSTNS